MKASINCYNIIKKWETLHDGNLKVIGLQPKMCPTGYWTIGYGHVVTYKGRMLNGPDDYKLALELYPALSIADAEKLLYQDVKEIEDFLNSLGIIFTQNQFDALVSFAFNVGTGALKNSTLLRRIKAGGNIREAFMMWVRGTVDGKRVTLKGLVYRRAMEADLYLKN